MPKLDSAAIAELLRELGLRLDLAGDNPYRARAYLGAADNIVLTPIPIEQLIAEERLQEIPGVGAAIAGLITELHQTGRHKGLEAMRQDIPAGVLEMLRIPGLRRDRVRKLYESGISSLEQLEAAARSGRLQTLKGYGPAFQAKVLQGIEMRREPGGRRLSQAARALEYTRKELARLHPQWRQLTVTGELRRGGELIRDLSLVAIDPLHRGEVRNVHLGDVTVYVSSQELYGAALFLTTGSDQHIEALRDLARKKGWTLDSAGLRLGNRVIAGEKEEDIYRALEIGFIPPELRESGEEVNLALKGQLPELVVQKDLHGVLHAHTDQSDGADTLEDMAEAARARGYSYLGLTDHSQTAHYAGGLKVEEVIEQQHAIDRLNDRYGSTFQIFKGIESDILADGALDYDEDVLRTFDLIIASVHSRFRMNREEQTERIVKAVSNPHTTILGHLTGRQLLRRPGYEVDMERILAACAQHGVAVEINASPWRLDLEWRWCQRALELGCLLSINPDAHATAEIDNVQWGVLMARKGAVPKSRVLNALSREQFEMHISERHKRASA